MTAIPAAGYFSVSTRTNDEARQAQDDGLEVLREFPGGQVNSELTLDVNGVIVPTAFHHTVDTYLNAGTDNLDNITTTNTPDGRLLMLTPENVARIVTVRDQQSGAGQIFTMDSSDVVLDSAEKGMILERVGTDWYERFRLSGIALNTGVGNYTDGVFHIHTASAGSVAASVLGDDLVVEGSTTPGISILSPATEVGRLIFGSPTNNTRATILYNHNNDTMDFYIANSFIARLFQSTFYINDNTANVNMSSGLTINQGANDDEILALKSSDIDHKLSSYSETDTYYSVLKQSPTIGGAVVRVLAEDDALATVYNTTVLGGTANTTKSTAGVGLINFNVFESDGGDPAAPANITANGNVFSIRAYVGGSIVTRMLVDEDGDLYSVTAAQTFDEHDDAALIDAYDTIRSIDPVKGEWTDFARSNEQKLIDLGILGGRIEDGGMTNVTQLTRLLTGAARQQAKKQTDLEAALCELVPGLENKLQEVRSLPNG